MAECEALSCKFGSICFDLVIRFTFLTAETFTSLRPHRHSPHLFRQAVAAFHDHSEVSPKQTLVVNHAGQLLPQATAMPRPPASAMPAGHEALGRLVRPKDALSEESERSQVRRGAN